MTAVETRRRRTEKKKNVTRHKIGLALGGGGARGLAHIVALEAFDELGIKPSVICGTSIGAIFGAAYASGLTATEIRKLARQTLGKRIDILRKLFGHSPNELRELWNLRPGMPSLLNPESLLKKVFPPAIARDFSDLQIALKIVATDFFAQSHYVIDQGSVVKAVAASIALPAIFTPPEIDGRFLIDGGVTNPLPFDVIAEMTDVTVAVDVTGGPVRNSKRERPTSLEVVFAASQISQNAIIREKLKYRAPTILIRPPVDRFQILAFYKIDEILETAAPIKNELMEKLSAALTHAVP